MDRVSVTKYVWLRDEPFGTESPTLLASFRLDDEDRVHAEFHAPGFEAKVRAGLPTPPNGTQPRVFVEDGCLFFEALDVAFVGSSLTLVTREG